MLEGSGKGRKVAEAFAAWLAGQDDPPDGYYIRKNDTEWWYLPQETKEHQDTLFLDPDQGEPDQNQTYYAGVIVRRQDGHTLRIAPTVVAVLAREDEDGVAEVMKNFEEDLIRLLEEGGGAQ
jgi:hypothetical protein